MSSEENNPITSGQRPREADKNDATSMQPTVILVQPVGENPINKNPSELLNVAEIGPWTVKCRLPASQSTSVGVIGLFGEDTSNEELTEALKDAGFNGAVAERIYNGKDKIKTSMFKAIFKTNDLLQCIRIGYQQYWVTTYIGKPWQCFKCQRFVHSAAFCRSAPCCVVYSGSHTNIECTTQQLGKIVATVVVTIQPIMEEPKNAASKRSGKNTTPKVISQRCSKASTVLM
ncbi:hypothetical protein FHG87_020215 [Trinorchestia longiramus]|nr:hypothetical protein FHG87_020215 [Trinorchestia longiramus]